MTEVFDLVIRRMALLRIPAAIILLMSGYVLANLPLGMDDGRLTDAQITASSCWDQNHCTDRARLNQPAGGGKTGAWSAKFNNQNQFIQADLRSLHQVSGVITQGRNAHDQWVTSFKVDYSLDGLTWTAALDAIQAQSEIFQGNSDRDTSITSDFAEPITARFVRFRPVTWAHHISMRFEVIGRVLPKESGREVALGMQYGMIPNNAITASTSYNANHGPQRARLDIVAGGGQTGAWSALSNNANQWIQVDLKKFYIVTGLITQGRQDADQWVRQYKVAHSLNGATWTTIPSCNGNDKIFSGNSNRNTKVTTSFDEPIIARFVRIHPTSWNNHISMRFEILGKGPVAGHRFEPLELGMESGRITNAQLSASTCYDNNHCTDRARLNQPAGGGRTGAWSTQTLDHAQWFQVDLLTNYMFHGIITQGRSDANQWVTSFKLQYKANGAAAFSNVVDEDGQQMTFTGNADRTSLVINRVPLPVTARYVRILPFTWSGHMSMRFELLGEGPINVVANPAKLGIEDGRVPVTGLSASSCYDGAHCVEQSRLNKLQPSQSVAGSWSARNNDVNQWIQVDLRAAFEVTGVITQGRHELTTTYNQWVKSYSMSYSIDGKDWIFVTDCATGQETKVFTGNNDRISLVQNAISPPVSVRFFRLHPLTWNNHISMRWELIGEGPVTLAGTSNKLGLQDYRIPDSSLTVSTQYDTNHSPARARLNIAASGALKGAWSARTLDHSQWLQIDLRGIYRVTGIITQGRADANQWVTSYKVVHSIDGRDWTDVLVSGTQQPQIFTGNSDRSTVVVKTFSTPLTTRFVRISPQTWNGHISMRAELLGAGPVADILQDPLPLGLENYVIPDSSITASSEFDANHGVKRGRLNLARVGDLRGAWSAHTNDVNQWMQVDLLYPFRIFGLTTQGRQDYSQWVTAYKVSCSVDGVTFDTVQGICTNYGADRVFTANSDQNTLVTNKLPVPQICRYVRVLPTTWHGHVSMRLELYGEGPIAE